MNARRASPAPLASTGANVVAALSAAVARWRDRFTATAPARALKMLDEIDALAPGQRPLSGLTD